jgi:hypothetical protein
VPLGPAYKADLAEHLPTNTFLKGLPILTG